MSTAPAADAFEGLPPLREVIARHGLAARKGLGQHFLLDLNLTRRIVRAAGDLDGVTVIEIGPGPGGLTRALLETAAAAVVAVERDERCVEALAGLHAAAAGRLILVPGDALAVDIAALTPAPRAVVANLPYNIGTPLLLGWLRRIDDFRSLTLMFQKEVADRLVARPGTRAYGRLSVITQWRAGIRTVMTLPARAFTPPPRIDSAVVRLEPHPHPDTAAPAFADMEAVTAAAFGQRRKMLRASLKSLGDAETLLRQAGIPPTARAEELGVAEFVSLATLWRDLRGAVPPPEP